MQAREMMYHKTNLNRIMSEYTGQSVEKVEADTDRDFYMSPLEAKGYGLIDHVVGGDNAGYNIQGVTKKFPRRRPKEPFNDDPEQLRGSRFRKWTEPYIKPLFEEEKKKEEEVKTES